MRRVDTAGRPSRTDLTGSTLTGSTPRPAGRTGRRALATGAVALAAASLVASAPVGSASASVAAGRLAASGHVVVGGKGAAWVSRATRWTARTRAAVGAASVAAAVPGALTDYLQGDRTDLQWSLQSTHVPQAWSASRGAGIVVATVDTGADTTASDLRGQLLPGGYLTPAGTIVAGTRPDKLGHGTHVAGIIAGADDGHGISGVAPDAKVLPVNVDTTDDLLTGKQVGAAITWASTHGARVINLSLGFSDVATGSADVKAICQAVSAAVARKVVVVAAAGNDGDGVNDAEAPASCAGAVSVAALDNDLHPTPWSSFDGTVTLAAPGAGIYSTVITDTSPLRYADESGTSMASPFVAGVAALVLAQHPDWTPAQVAQRLTSTATDLAPSGRDPRTGAGVVDPAAAVGVSAPAPAPAPAITAQADPYASHTGKDGLAVFDQVELHWVPDPTFPATGYRITRWTAAGAATSTVSAGTVRALFPAGAAGYQVTALSADGEVPSAPLWFPLAGQDYTPLYAVTGLRVAWTKSGGITLHWTNPPKNKGRADQYAIFLNGDIAVSAENVTIPSTVTVPAGVVPAGDLVVSVMIGSSGTLDIEETKAALTARVPFSGTAVGAGKGRYRVDLVLAPSRRALCGRSRCTGTSVTVTVGGYAHTTQIDSTGHAVVLGSAKASHGRITVRVTVPDRPALSDRAVVVPVH